MNKILINKLLERESSVNIAIIGCGWWGSGVAKAICKVPNIIPRVLVDKEIDRCINLYLELGIKKKDIAIVKNFKELQLAQDEEKFIVFTDLSLIRELKGIDVVHEAIGDVYPGVMAALYSIEAGIHFTTVNAEMDATVGLVLANRAKQKGIVYSNTDGDQPGCLARMLDDIISWGFEPKIIGNNKFFLDYYQNPTGIKPFVPNGQSPYKLCSAADGAKLALEMAVVANAFGYPPLKRGMYGPETKKSDLIKTFNDLINLDSIKGGHIDYTMGTTEPNQGGPIFVIGYTDDLRLKEDMKHLKKGDGPYFLFFRDHHLCTIEAPSTIAEAALFKVPTITPKGRYADVLAVAKKDIQAGQKIDGIGGNDCFGLVECANVVSEKELLPIGLAEFATANKNIKKDTVITYNMVDISNNIVFQLRKEQDKLPLI